MTIRRIPLAVLVGIMALLLPFSQPVHSQAVDCGEVYVVQPGDTLREIAARCGVSQQSILDLNPFIEDPNLIYAGWILDISPAASQVLIPQTGAGPRSDALYVVKAGDTLSYIARRLDIAEDTLLAANPNLQENDDLRTGQILRLSNNISSPAAAASPSVVEPGQVVTVLAGGFPANIGLEIAGGPLGEQGAVLQRVQTGSDGWVRTNVTIPSNAERGNRWALVVHLENNRNIRALTNLLYVVDTSGPAEPILYTVRVNDSLSAIANRFGVTIDQILGVNPQVENARVIVVGQEILIPGALMRQQPGGDQAGVFLGPVSGPAGSEVEVFGTGFNPNTRIDLRVGRSGEEEELASSELQTSQRGTFYTTITIPEGVSPDETLMVVADAGEEMAAAQYHVAGPGIPQTGDGDVVVLPQIELDRASGLPGTIFSVRVTGYPANTPIEMGIGRSQADPNIVYAYRTEADGSFFARIQVPENVQAGEFFIITFNPTQGSANVPGLSARFDVTQ